MIRTARRHAGTSSPASAFGAHDMGWIRSHCPTTARVQVRDLTSARAVDQPVRPARPRRAAGGVRGRRLQRRLPLRPGARASRSVRRRCWRCASATSASSAGSCTSRPSTPPTSTSVLRDAGRAARHRRRRLPGDRHAADGEGLPVLVDRRHARHHPVGGRARVAGQPGTRATSAGATRWSRSATPASTRRLCTFTLEQMAYPVGGEAIIARTTTSSGSRRAPTSATRSASRSPTATCRSSSPTAPTS